MQFVTILVINVLESNIDVPLLFTCYSKVGQSIKIAH